MTVTSNVFFAVGDSAVVAGWIWSLWRAWHAGQDPDLELAIEAARHDPQESRAPLRRDAVDWKHRLENRASYPAFASAVISGITLGFSGNAVGRGTGYTDTWIVSVALLFASLAVAFSARLITAKRIQRRLPHLLGR